VLKTKLKLSSEEQTLLLEVLLEQRYASEVVSNEITDIETGQKTADESRLKLLNNLLVRLHSAGY
jgi:hypothetical protein